MCTTTMTSLPTTAYAMSPSAYMSEQPVTPSNSSPAEFRTLRSTACTQRAVTTNIRTSAVIFLVHSSARSFRHLRSATRKAATALPPAGEERRPPTLDEEHMTASACKPFGVGDMQNHLPAGPICPTAAAATAASLSLIGEAECLYLRVGVV